MDPLDGPVEVFSEVGEAGFVQIFDLYLVLDGVHGGVEHDVLDAFLLGDLGKQSFLGWGSVSFSGGGEEELVLNIVNGHGLDEDGVDGGGDDGLHPGRVVNRF